MGVNALRNLLTIALLAAAWHSSTAQTPLTVLEYHDPWSYVEGNSTPTDWSAIGYDDSAWPRGHGLFGFPINEPLPSGIAPINTVLNTNTGGGYIITHYFR